MYLYITPQNKIGWNTLALKGRVSATLVLKKSGVEDARKGFGFILLDTTVCDNGIFLFI